MPEMWITMWLKVIWIMTWLNSTWITMCQNSTWITICLNSTWIKRRGWCWPSVSPCRWGCWRRPAGRRGWGRGRSGITSWYRPTYHHIRSFFYLIGFVENLIVKNIIFVTRYMKHISSHRDRPRRFFTIHFLKNNSSWGPDLVSGVFLNSRFLTDSPYHLVRRVLAHRIIYNKVWRHILSLKVPKHEIFYGGFFFASKNPSGPLIHNLKWFQI